MKLYKCQTFAKCDMPYCSTPAKFVFPIKGKLRKEICLCDECAKEMYQELAKEQIKIAFDQSEKEVADLHQRTKEGIETARLNGKQIGQKKGNKLTTKKSIASKEVILKHSKDFNGSLCDTDVMKLTGLSRNTFYKYKREIKETLCI